MIGLAAGITELADLVDAVVLAWASFFLLPANLLIYGVNDVFDYATDRLNPKKAGYEFPLAPESRGAFWRRLGLILIPYGLLLVVTPVAAIGMLLGWLFFSVQYSAPPIRAKTKPLLDSAFNVLYVFPGIMAYLLVGGDNLSWEVVAAAALWCAAMHAYSAVPDITADTRAGLRTVATTLGHTGTLLFCALCYILAAALIKPTLGSIGVAIGNIYAALMIISLFLRQPSQLLRAYKVFPIINTLVGAGLVVTLLLQQFPPA